MKRPTYLCRNQCFDGTNYCAAAYLAKELGFEVTGRPDQITAIRIFLCETFGRSESEIQQFINDNDWKKDNLSSFDFWIQRFGVEYDT